MIIGLTGYAGVGKDAFAEALRDLAGFRCIAFSDPLHEMAMVLNPRLTNDGHNLYTYRDAIEEYGYTEAKKRNPGLRSYLQVLGTEAGREILGKDVWVNVAKRTIRRNDAEGAHTAVTGVRYTNEAWLVIDLGGTVVRIDRPGFKPSNGHTSDTSVDEIPVHRVIVNDGSLDDLRAKARELLEELGFSL